MLTNLRHSRPKVIAIVPALNEQATIGSVIEKIHPFVNEVIVIDDGSKDKTGDIAREKGAFVLFHPRPMGYDRSIEDGFAMANHHEADVVVTFDADGQHHPEDIERAVCPILEGRADVVVGRRPQCARITELWFKHFAKKQFGIDDPLCGLKAYHMGVYRNFGYFDKIRSIGTQLVFNARQKGFRILQIEINIKNRKDESRFGKKVSANWKIFKAMIKVWLWRMRNEKN